MKNLFIALIAITALFSCSSQKEKSIKKALKDRLQTVSVDGGGTIDMGYKPKSIEIIREITVSEYKDSLKEEIKRLYTDLEAARSVYKTNDLEQLRDTLFSGIVFCTEHNISCKPFYRNVSRIDSLNRYDNTIHDLADVDGNKVYYTIVSHKYSMVNPFNNQRVPVQKTFTLDCDYKIK